MRCCTLNLGFLLSFAIFAVVAMCLLFLARTTDAGIAVAGALLYPYLRNGIPICRNNANASLSFCAVVTMVTFMPLAFSTFE